MLNPSEELSLKEQLSIKEAELLQQVAQAEEVNPNVKYSCPITCAPISDPVITSDGQTYEKAALLQWAKICRDSGKTPTTPTTRVIFDETRLFPNIFYKNTLEAQFPAAKEVASLKERLAATSRATADREESPVLTHQPIEFSAHSRVDHSFSRPRAIPASFQLSVLPSTSPPLPISISQSRDRMPARFAVDISSSVNTAESSVLNQHQPGFSLSRIADFFRGAQDAQSSAVPASQGVQNNSVATPQRSSIQNIKVIVIGDSIAGNKWRLINRFAENDLYPSFINTVGIDFKCVVRQLDDCRVKYTVWDTSGQERFRTITAAYYRGASAVILMYDTADRASFENIRGWRESVLQHTSGAHLYLVGSCPNHEFQRQVELESGRRLAAEFNVPFFECSSGTGQNIEELFEKIGRDYLNRSNQASAAMVTPRS